MDQFQDALAIGIAALTASWLAWTLFKRIQKPSCGPRTDIPAGSDGFVALHDLAAGAKKSGRREGRPDR
jgi:hypothetical protein